MSLSFPNSSLHHLANNSSSNIASRHLPGAGPPHSHLAPYVGSPLATNSLPVGLDTTTSLSRSVSADAAGLQYHAPPSSSSAQYMVQRLTQQNASIREAWEAERNYLEANRRRAEEVYQEERLIMEDVREAWYTEKNEMQYEMQALRERIQRLEGENSTLKAVAAQSIQVTGVVSPLASLRGDSADDSTGSPSYFSVVPCSVPAAASSLKQSRHHNDRDLADPLPPGLDGASRRPHFAGPGSSRTSPSRQPDSSNFVTLDPRTEPKNSTTQDFLSPILEPTDMAPVPIIDVMEIDPKLEGISLKATAIQKSTFVGSSTKSSPATSPPANTNLGQLFSPQDRPLPVKRGSSKDHTVQVMAVEESRRLTMHAGHTPNHSLSLFPTMTTVTETSTVVGQSEEHTPNPTSTRRHTRINARGGRLEPLSHQKGRLASLSDAPSASGETGELDDTLMDPSDDVPLKGPLMVKNIPAQDEIFWEAVNRKLEPISQGLDALPTVMQAALTEPDAVTQDPSGHSAKPRTLPPIPVVGGDAANDTNASESDDNEAAVHNNKTMLPEVPLKFKSTSNFGAPFGAM